MKKFSELAPFNAVEFERLSHEQELKYLTAFIEALDAANHRSARQDRNRPTSGNELLKKRADRS